MKTLLYILLAFTITANAQQEPFKALKRSEIKKLIRKAKANGEIDKTQYKKFESEYKDAVELDTDPNAIFDYGRILTALIKPAYNKMPNNPPSDSVNDIAVEAERAYHYAINNCECHGRANIMLGLLYNLKNNWYASEPFLEKGLKLKEGGEDWMVAANQYLLAGAYTYNTEENKYQNIYKLFKKYVESASKDKAYYQKMAAMYKPYYEK